MTLKFLLILILPFLFCEVSAQSDPGIQKITDFPSRFLDKINSKASSLELKLDRQTEKYLQHLARKENKLKRKLLRLDSNAAKNAFGNSEQQYAELANKLEFPDIT